MRIAVIAPTFIPARRANTIQVMKMTQALRDVGHIPHLIVPDLSHDPKPSWDDLSHFYGLKHAFPITWLRAYPWLRRYDFGWRAVRWAQAWGADIIYTRLPQAAAVASWWGIDTIFEVHDMPQGNMGPLLFRLFIRGPRAYRLVVISQALLDDLIKEFSVPQSVPFTIVAPDGVDLERYVDLPDPKQARKILKREAKANLEPEQFTVGYSGHLYPGRGKEFILELAKRLRQVNFLIVGGEPKEVSELRTMVKSRGLSNLILTGFVPNAELPIYQAACDVLLMPYQPRVAASSGGDISRYLSPMKLFEYLACGRAILSSDLPVFQEVLSPEVAVLLPPEDVDAWIKALDRLRKAPEQRVHLSEQARCKAQGYSWTKRAAKILES